MRGAVKPLKLSSQSDTEVILANYIRQSCKVLIVNKRLVGTNELTWAALGDPLSQLGAYNQRIPGIVSGIAEIPWF